LSPVKRELQGITGECPNCRGRLVKDPEKGEVLCPKCGFVALDQTIDSTPEWKSMDYEERSKRMRTGGPSTYSRHDLGLTTEIATDLRDSHGNYLHGINKENAEHLKKWNRRIQTSGPGERGLIVALAKITEISSAMRLPSNVTEDASLLFRKSAKSSMSKSKSVAGNAVAALYLACRRANINRTLKEICVVAGVKPNHAAKYYRNLRSLGAEVYIPPPSVQKYISKLVNKEKINPRVERLALDLSERTSESEISSGKTPAGLAGAYVYIASVLAGEHIPQRDIAEAAEVTEVTVRNRCREILEKFQIKQTLKPMKEVLA
jgi:transcription initiation factor TFIIB